MPRGDDNNDLEAFFAAARDNNPAALDRAAQQIADDQARQQTAPQPGRTTAGRIPPAEEARADAVVRDSYGPKYIAIEPVNEDGDPFTVVPQALPLAFPWWAWASVAVVLLGVFLAIMFMPGIELSALTASLTDSGNPSQTAMRQLVMRGDERTVDKLYEMASSQSNELAARLNAIDVLSLISEPSAERALLRLELAGGTDATVRQHAIAARKQREAAAARTFRE